MGFKVFKNEWDQGKHTEAQMDHAIQFLMILDEQVMNAMGKLETNDAFQEFEGFPKVESYYRVLDTLFTGAQSAKNRRRIRTFAARTGSAVEEMTYDLLISDGGADTYEDAEMVDQESDFNVAFEQTLPFGTAFPTSFKGRKGGRSSRPDIRLSLGTGKDGKTYEALFDITANTVQSKGHILSKAGSWLTRTYVPFIAEVYYNTGDAEW